MQSGNGIDLSAIHQLLTEVAQTVRGHGERFDRIEARFDRIDERLTAHEGRFDGIAARLDSRDHKLNELIGTVNDHSRKLDLLLGMINEHSRKIDDFGSALGELRATVQQVHSAVIGHGMDITDLGERLAALERSRA